MPRSTGRLSDVLGWFLVSLLTVLSLSYVTTELAYDEAIYLRLSREIAESGLPFRRQFEKFDDFRLFQNSPPLVLYVAALSQRFWPGSDRPARLVQIAVFVLPTYVAVWLITRRRFGPLAGIASLLSLIASGAYMRATPQVALDVPLGLLAILVLFAFEQASRTDGARWHWAFAAAAGIVLAAWTKYQAVCICIGVAAYAVFAVASRGRRAARELALPLAAVVVAGLCAVGLLIAFYLVFGGSSGFERTLAHNTQRMSTGPLSPLAWARAVLDTATESVTRLGGVLLLLSSIAVLVQRHHRDWLVLLTSYVAATLAFNLWFFRLPGAGEHYLDSVVPALALLAGPAAVGFGEFLQSRARRVALAAVLFAIQFAGSPPPLYASYRNSPRMAAAYIASRGTPTAGILANSVALEFYAGNPVRVIGFVPPDLLRRSLEGTSGDDISFVVVDRDRPPAGIESIRCEWETLLARYFVQTPAQVPGMLVYERKTAPARQRVEE